MNQIWLICNTASKYLNTHRSAERSYTNFNLYLDAAPFSGH